MARKIPIKEHPLEKTSRLVHDAICGQFELAADTKEGMKHLAVAAAHYWMTHAPDGQERDGVEFMRVIADGWNAVSAAAEVSEKLAAQLGTTAKKATTHH